MGRKDDRVSKTEDYVTKSIKVKAAQITAGNIRELADWVREHGLTASIMTIGAISTGQLALRVHTERATLDGNFGDWVTLTDTGDLEMWSDADFRQRFEAI